MAFRLLDIIVTKRGEVAFTEIKTTELFEHLRQMYGPNKDVKLIYSYEEGVILGEANLLKSVLANLVDNAIKASEQGGRVEIFGKNTPEGYAFGVKDYGVGIPAEECKKITEAFYMVDKSRSRSKNGAGLGLALCSAILELHHSRLTIESVLGEGSNIGFTIPKEEVIASGQNEN